MAGLVPAIHVFLMLPETWMPGTSPGMTSWMHRCLGPLSKRIGHDAAVDAQRGAIGRAGGF
jgi:hypothetical protein